MLWLSLSQHARSLLSWLLPRGPSEPRLIVCHLELFHPDSSSDRCQTPLSLVLSVPWKKLSVLVCHCNLVRATKDHSPLWQVSLISALGRRSWHLNSSPLRRLLGSLRKYIQSLSKSLQTEHKSLLNRRVFSFFKLIVYYFPKSRHV